ncbi:hypothetical protein GGS21DRAFT_504505 [Xylaria nigripes]|nr:hypothetical protein GGS21DRAFT_504505 [Xylaria nigripes]
MGFATGFTGGVTLTLGIAYLTVLAHQRNREHQAAILRQQTYILSGIIDPLPPTFPPTRAELAAAERANFKEAAKDRWNAEVENAAKWVHSKDWNGVREDMETIASRLWGRAMGQSSVETTKVADNNPTPLRDLSTSKVKEEAREKSDSVVAAAKSAYADAKAKSSELVTKAEEKAEVTKDSIKGAIEKGVEKSKEFLVLNGAEKKLDMTLSPAEEILRQRYEGSSGPDQTVEEILAARYAPIDEKNTGAKAL